MRDFFVQKIGNYRGFFLIQYDRIERFIFQGDDDGDRVANKGDMAWLTALFG